MILLKNKIWLALLRSQMSIIVGQTMLNQLFDEKLAKTQNFIDKDDTVSIDLHCKSHVGV